MTIEIETSSGFFDGDSFDEILKAIVKEAEEENDFWVSIESIHWNDFTWNHLIEEKQLELDELLLKAKEENDIDKRDYIRSLYQDQYQYL
jgi:hypothetical protein